MSTLHQLEEKIYSLVPELKELTFGCEVKNKDGRILKVLCCDPEVKCIYNGNTEYLDWGYEIIGHEIHLEHIMKCLGRDYILAGNGDIYKSYRDFEDGIIGGEYDIEKSFSDNSPEFHEWLWNELNK